MELKVIELDIDKTDEIYVSEDCQQLIDVWLDYYPKIGFNPPWVGYFVVRDGKIVGTCAFVEQPKDGTAEIAYATFKEFEGQGIASFSCKELIKIAYSTDPSLTVTAKTAPEENASVRILKKNGFTYSGIVQDHEIGDAWLWTHQKNLV